MPSARTKDRGQLGLGRQAGQRNPRGPIAVAVQQLPGQGRQEQDQDGRLPREQGLNREQAQRDGHQGDRSRHAGHGVSEHEAREEEQSRG